MILLLLIVLLLFGAPSIGYYHSPQAGIGLGALGGILVIVLIVLLLTGRL